MAPLGERPTTTRVVKYLGGNMMRKMIGIALIALLGFSGAAFGQTAQDAFKSLKKIDKLTQTGIAYQDYPQILADAKKEVDLYLKSNTAKKNPQLANNIKTAMDYYITAKEVWDIKFNCKNDFIMEAIGINTDCGKALKRLYHKSKAEILPGNLGPFYVVSNILRSIFNDASHELTKASKIMKIS
jgi:hypothetical protein